MTICLTFRGYDYAVGNIVKLIINFLQEISLEEPAW